VTNKEKYRLLCQNNSDINIFMQDWWLDALCGDSWDVLLKEQNNKIIATLPYFIQKKYGFKTILPSHLTPINALWISYEQGMNLTTRYTFEIEVMEYFAHELDKLGLSYYCQKFHHKITNWLGFYWNGFSQTTYYTYRIEDLSDIESVNKNISSKKRRSIRNAMETIVVDEDISNEDFYNLLSMSFERQHKTLPYTFETFERMEKACSERGVSKKLVAKDNKGNKCAVMYLILSNSVCYTLASGANPKQRDSGAMALLNWKAIEIANQMSMKEIDFTGSMMQNVEKFLRFYGAKQTPYFLIEKKYSKLYSLLKNIK
jgi:hypothetical protein